MKVLPSPLCAIVDVEVAERAAWSPTDLATAYLNGGARFLQLRAKSLSGSQFLDLASDLRDLAHGAGAIVIINDRADIARLCGADGVHVGQDDLPPLAVRGIVGTESMIGLSTHTEPQIESAIQQPIDYIAIGPVFGTATKATGYAAVGLERVRYASAHMKVVQAVRPAVSGEPEGWHYTNSDCFTGSSAGPGEARLKADATRPVGLTSDASGPLGVVAIGGITLDCAADVISAGATAVAVITDLIVTGEPEARVRAYLARLR